MNKIKVLLQKFWQRSLTDIESKELDTLLQQDENEFKTELKDSFDKYFNNQQAAHNSNKGQEILTKLLVRIDKYEYNKIKSINLKRKLFWYAAAASLIGLAISGSLFFSNPQKAIVAAVSIQHQKVNDSFKSVTNNGSTNKTITLIDGSVVTLTPNAAITYYEPFPNNRRDISLTGTALFKVAKDKFKPFTVYSSGITTTALGTMFWIYADNKNKVGVKLLEGKVVIKATPDAGVKMDDVYLIPGQQINIDKSKHNVFVDAARTDNNNHKPNVLVKRNVQSADLVFEKESLINLFEKLDQKFSVHISYDESEIKDLYFTGKFLYSDSLHNILSLICTINDLKFDQHQKILQSPN
jgi:transmembrane sensor